MRVLGFQALSELIKLSSRVESCILCEWVELPHSPIPLMHIRELLVPDAFLLQNPKFPWRVLKSVDPGNDMTYVIFQGLGHGGDPWEFLDWLNPGIALQSVGFDDKCKIEVLKDLWDILIYELKYLSDFLNTFDIGNLCITGHAKGGIAAQIFGLLVSPEIMGEDSDLGKQFRISALDLRVVTFGSPEVIYRGASMTPSNWEAARCKWVTGDMSAGVMQAFVIPRDPLPALFGARHEEVAGFYMRETSWLGMSEKAQMLHRIYGLELTARAKMSNFQGFLQRMEVDSKWEDLANDVASFEVGHNAMPHYTDSVLHHILVKYHETGASVTKGFGVTQASRAGLFTHILKRWHEFSRSSVQARLDGICDTEPGDDDGGDEIVKENLETFVDNFL